jgi:hypothetical protein
LMNLAATNAEELTTRLRACWQAEEPLVQWPKEKVRDLVAERYGREEWTRRR